MNKDGKTADDSKGTRSETGANRALIAALAAGYALQRLFCFVGDLVRARDDGDVKTEQDTRAAAVAAQCLIEWFREKGVTFDEDLQPLVPATVLDLSWLDTMHAEAMQLALQAIHAVADVTEDLWSDPDCLAEFVQAMSLDAFSAGPPNRLWVGDRETGEMVELVREVCARMKSTGQLVDLDGFPASPFPRRPFLAITGPSKIQ
jgi:hypothetical protein